DILPILPGKSLDRDFLCHFLRQPRMVELATAKATGANLPRLSPKVLGEFEIPLLPLSEQRRIAVILDKADELRAKRQSALEQLSGLIQAMFAEIFGDSHLPKRTIGDLLASNSLLLHKDGNHG